MTETQQDLVLHLLREGEWRDAVMAYAEETGVTTDEANEAVKALAVGQNIQRSGSRWLMIAAIASMLSLAAGWVIARPF